MVLNEPEAAHRETLQEAVREPPCVDIDDRAWASHLASWAAEGFDHDAMTAALGADPGSDDLIALASVLDRARSIISRLDGLPATFVDAAAALTSRLHRDPFDADSVQNELAAMLLARAPWVPAAERSRPRWSAEGRSIELEAWLRRLTPADASSRIEADGVVRAIEAVRPRAEVRRAIEALEARQREREEVLHDLLEILETAGWLVEEARIGTLAQRFDAAGELQRMDARSREIESAIERRVAAWRPESAADLLERMAEVKQMPDHDLIERLAAATDSAIAGIASERAAVEEEVASWNEQGVVLPDHPDDAALFRAHSDQGDSWRAAVRISTEASERILEHMDDATSEIEIEGRLWHAEDAEALDRTAGRLDREAELVAAEADATLRVWRAHGIEVGELVERVDARPRTAAAEIERLRGRVEGSIAALARVTAIDGSVVDDDRLHRWADSLRELPSDGEMAEILDGIDRLERRHERHRSSLDAARRELGGSWPSDVDASELDLTAYEELVVALESGSRITGRSVAAERLEPHEIDAWASEGWDVSGLRERAREDPVGLARDLPGYRRAVLGYDDLVRLLEPLPWGRDPNLASEVETSLRRPDKLPDLASRRRRIASHLASMRPSAERPLMVFEPTVSVDRRIEIVVEADEAAMPESPGPAFPSEAAHSQTMVGVDGSIETTVGATAAPVDPISGAVEVGDGGASGDVDASSEPEGRTIESVGESGEVEREPEEGVSESVDEPEEVEREPDARVSESVDESEAVEREPEEGVIESVDEAEEVEREPEETRRDPQDDSDGQEEPVDAASGSAEESEGVGAESAEVGEPDVRGDAVEAESDPMESYAFGDGGPIQQPPPATIEWSEPDEGDMPSGVDAVLARLGLEGGGGLPSTASSTLRDIRVQRLIRLTGLVGGMEPGPVRDALAKDLADGARSLEDWTALRLVNRRARSGDGLLVDSERLVERLDDVPGPGVPLPVGVDDHPLPEADDADGIAGAVAAWRTAVDLPLAGRSLADA